MSWFYSWKSAVCVPLAVLLLTVGAPHVQAWSARGDCATLLDSPSESQLQSLRNKVIREYTRLAKAKGEFPTLAELQNATQLKRSEFKTLFKDFEDLREQAVEKYRNVFRTVQDTEVFSSKRYNAMMKDLKQYKRFIITADVPGGELHEGFYKTIKGYQKEKDAALIVTPQNNETTFMTPELKEEHVAFRDVPLNDHLSIKALPVEAKHIPPARRLRQLAQNGVSFIFASPKRYMEWVPVGNIKYPRVVMTTGAITKANYSTGGREKFGDKSAASEHVVGAVVVELDDAGNFHFRQITAREDGSFVDLGRLYRPNGTSVKMTPEALVLGDWHSGQTDPDVVKNTDDITTTLRPRVRVYHDIFNGLSINHHEVGRSVTQSRLAQEGKGDLAAELQGVADDLLAAVKNKHEEVVVVKSNHDEFLDRYLEEDRDRKDKVNAQIGNVLWGVKNSGGDPLEAGVRMFWKGTAKEWEKVRWLKRDEDFTVGDVQLGAHGDLGANGSYPSMATLSTIYPKSVTGHIHTAAILGDVWRVGTSSLFRMGYNRGPSSWTHTHALVYEDGTVQLINIVNGAWHRAD